MTHVHVQEFGHGRAIVWIHGFPLSSQIFEPQTRIRNLRHIMIDLPGFGWSAPSPIDSMDDYADVVIDVVKSLKLVQPVLAGVSMGGYVALAIARKEPDLASAMILIDTRERPDNETGRQNRLDQIATVEKAGTRQLIDSMIPMMLTPETVVADDDRLAIVRRSMEIATVDGVTAALRAMANREDSTPTLASMSCPVLVVVGSDDKITTLEDARRMVSIAPNARLVEIGNAGHLSNLERPVAFNAAARNFLGEPR